MKVKGSNLIFISQIRRDGSGTIPVTDEYKKSLQEDDFDLICLSMTEETYIASEKKVQKALNEYLIKK